ncbi:MULTISPECIES: hypothetical protein [Carboxylicivirga]|nr:MULTISPECIES: hypothetical protein [Carboxylicivirga]
MKNHSNLYGANDGIGRVRIGTTHTYTPINMRFKLTTIETPIF